VVVLRIHGIHVGGLPPSEPHLRGLAGRDGEALLRGKADLGGALSIDYYYP